MIITPVCEQVTVPRMRSLALPSRNVFLVKELEEKVVCSPPAPMQFAFGPVPVKTILSAFVSKSLPD